MKEQSAIADSAAGCGLIGKANAPYHPLKALTRLPEYANSFAGHPLWQWETEPAPSEKDEAVQDMADQCVGYLPHGPLLVQLVERDGEEWALTVNANYAFSHAVAVIRYDDADRTLQYADPARDGTMTRTVPIEDFVTGFFYADQSMFGARALGLFVTPPDQVFARAKTMWQIQKTIGRS